MGSSDNLVGMNHAFTAEFNISLDPEAAYLVLNSFAEVVVVSFDTTICNINPKDTLHLLSDEKTKKSKFVSDIYGEIKKKHDPSICDPLAFFPLFRPDCVQSGVKIEMIIELKGKRTRGATKVNWFNEDPKKKNCYLVKKMDLNTIIEEITASYQDIAE